MRRGGGMAIFAALALMSATLGTAFAQEQPAEATPDPGPAAQPDLTGKVLVLDQDRLFRQSRFGQASLARENAAARALEAENNRILVDLIAEEQGLTTARKTLPPAEFTLLADAFDAKAERIRRAQDAKLAALVAARDKDRGAFARAIGPILSQLLQETGAAVILDAAAVVGYSPAFEITDDATLRVDRVLDTPPEPAPPEPAPPELTPDVLPKPQATP